MFLHVNKGKYFQFLDCFKEQNHEGKYVMEMYNSLKKMKT